MKEKNKSAELCPPCLPVGYVVVRKSEEGVDAIWEKDGFRVFVGWDVSLVYLPSINAYGRAMRGRRIRYVHELELLEKMCGDVAG